MDAELLVRFHCKYPESDEDLVFHEASIDVGKLFLLQENFSIAALSTVPRNSIFLWVDDKEVLMENSLYLSLRKSNQIKARNGSMLAHLEDKAADPGGPDAEEVLNESILSDMNSLLVDEDERNVALRSDIDAGTSRVDTLRAEAEVFLAGRPTSTRDPSTALQLLELQEVIHICSSVIYCFACVFDCLGISCRHRWSGQKQRRWPSSAP